MCKSRAAYSSRDQPGRQSQTGNLLRQRIQKITLTSITTTQIRVANTRTKKDEISSHLSPLRDLIHMDAHKACGDIFDV